MSNHYGHWANIECPFFREDNISSILCEGCEENSTVRQSFNTKQSRIDWEKKFCYNSKTSASCPIYEIVNRKYEE